MDNLIFSLNATVPVFMMMVLGMLFRKLGWMDTDFANKLNKFVFLVPLPVLVFKDLAQVDIADAWNGKFVLFCFVVTLLSIIIAALLSIFLKNRGTRGEFVQAAYRSSAALLGMALIENIYGSSTMGPLMIIGSVPLYNIFAVIILTVTSKDNNEGISGKLLIKILKGVITNPIIIGIVIGLAWSAIGIPLEGIVYKTVNNIAVTATPLGLMAMGANFEFDKAIGKIWPSIGASLMKLVGFVAIFIPLAIKLGFRGEAIIAILIMLGSATTVSCYVMAKNMGHEGVLTSSVVMITTLLSAFTLTMWLFILKTIGVI